jgi:hypothetical protein
VTPQRGAEPLNFKVQRASTVAALEQRVSSMREQGWETSGSMFYDGATVMWCQPMKRKPDKPDGDKLKLKEGKPPADCHFSIG